MATGDGSPREVGPNVAQTGAPSGRIWMVFLVPAPTLVRSPILELLGQFTGPIWRVGSRIPESASSPAPELEAWVIGLPHIHHVVHVPRTSVFAPHPGLCHLQDIATGGGSGSSNNMCSTKWRPDMSSGARVIPHALRQFRGFSESRQCASSAECHSEVRLGAACRQSPSAVGRTDLA